MRYEVTTELLEEMAHCIVDNGLDCNEAIKYMKSCVREVAEEDIVEVLK